MTWISDLIRSLARPLQWWIVVAAWEQGILVRLGKNPRLLAPGIHPRIPFLDRVLVTCTRERVTHTDNRTVAYGDGRRAITFCVSVRFAVHDFLRLTMSVARPEETIRTIAMASAALVISRSNCPTRDLVEACVQEKLLAEVGEWGITPPIVSVTGFSESRVLRLIIAQDHGYTGLLDGALDTSPAAVS